MATPRSGQVTVTTAGTAVQGTDAPGNHFAIKAHDANTGIIYVGNDDAASPDVNSTTGFPLEANEPQLVIQVPNLNALWFDASVNGEKACWIKID